MARIGGRSRPAFDRLSYVGLFTRNYEKSREFFMSCVGLEVREDRPDRGYAAVGVAGDRAGASLAIIQPNRELWSDDYDDAAGHIGEPVASFRATNVRELGARLRDRGVNARDFATKGHPWVWFEDPDRNTFVAHEDPWATAAGIGFTALDHVNVVTKDEARAAAFFTKRLGLQSVAFSGWAFVEYRVWGAGTAVVPFTPTPDMYDGWTDPANCERDLARVGERTYIVFTSSLLGGVRRRLARSGVQCRARPPHPV